MKSIYFVFTSLILLIFTSCNKIEIVNPNFDVTTEKTTYKIGEDVTFRLSGNPNFITFYSGEPLNEYEYSDGRILPTDSLFASFYSKFIWFTSPDQVSVLTSTDFNGKYTIDDVLAANWTSGKTNEFTLASKHNVRAFSNKKEVSPIDKKDNMFFAFKYRKKAYSESGKGRFWYIDQVDLQTKTLLGDKTLFNGSKFTLIYDKNFKHDSLKLASVSSAGMISISVPSTLDPFDTEIWAVSPSIELGDLDLGPDKGVAVKGYRNPMPAEYIYEYTKPGIYYATFVGNNTNSYGKSEPIVRQIKFTISN